MTETISYTSPNSVDQIEPTGFDRLLEQFGDFIDQRAGAIGRVVGSEREPSGSHQFFFWASDSARTLDVGHIVAAFSEDAVVVGVVDEPRRYSDLKSFLDDYFDRHVEDALDEEPPTRRPEILVFSVNVLATKHIRDDVDSHRPPTGGPVYFATPEAIEYATGKHEFDGRAIPALLHTNGNPEYDDDGQPLHDDDGNIVFQRAPLWLDEDYLLGPEAGHGNWTGQSGLATKTSHVLFLISAIIQKLRVPDTRGETKRVAALMFNVKGPDLLWLDKPANPADEERAIYEAEDARLLREEDFAAYAAMGLQPSAFDNFRIFAPFKPQHAPSAPQGNTYVSLESVSDIYRDLNTLRNRQEEATDRVFPILWDIAKLLGFPNKLFEQHDLDDKLFGLVDELRELDCRSLVEIEETLNRAIGEMNDDGSSEWRGHHKATVSKARNRFKNLGNKFGGLISNGRVNYGNLPKVDGEFKPDEVRVVDIAHCNTNVQEVLVSSIVNEIWKKAERNELGVDKVIIFVDELNKYAASGTQNALRDTLVDIAARGRHLNVVLFGAQQFRSKVDDEILGNCGTSFYGRVGDEEITNASYRSLSENTKTELLGLPKGRLLARHAHFRAPVFGTFPLPPTVAGSAGQRLFNDDAAQLTAQPGEALYRLMMKIEPKPPTKADVMNACAGVDAATVTKITTDVDMEHHRNQTKGSGPQRSPWQSAQNRLRAARH